MRISSIRIENFRSFADQTILLDSYTCLVGANGAGKSAVLSALNVFFRNTASSATNVVKLCEEDFHHRNTSKPIRITVVFSHLTPDAKETFKHYVRQDQLIVTAKAEWDHETQQAEVKQYGLRKVMSGFATFFSAENEGAVVADLREIYNSLREKYPELSRQTSKPAMSAALRAYEEAHPELCELQESSDEFYGWSRGANLLGKFLTWVYIPAVKDATSEQEESNRTALGQLLDRTIRSKVNFAESMNNLKKELEGSYRSIIDEQSAALSEVGVSLEQKLRSWANPGASLKLKWHYDTDKSIVINPPVARAVIGEDSFLGEVARLGHGMQRSFLVSLLHELASLNSESGPTLILGFEEPELYQHPPQAQHVASVLEAMGKHQNANAQVIVSTHSPYFVSSRGFECVRLVRKHREDCCSVISHTTFKRVEGLLAEAFCRQPQSPNVMMAKIEQIMQPSQRELYFCRVAVLVEGIEDIAFLATHLQVKDRFEDFRRFGCHFVIGGGKNSMSRPLAIAKELGIPTFVIFDGDGDDSNQQNLRKRKEDNACLLKLCGINDCDPIPKETVFREQVVMWSTNIMKVVEADFGDRWNKIQQQVRNDLGLSSGGVREKNSLLIAATLEKLASEGYQSQTLDRVCEILIRFAKGVAARTDDVSVEDVTALPGLIG